MHGEKTSSLSSPSPSPPPSFRQSQVPFPCSSHCSLIPFRWSSGSIKTTMGGGGRRRNYDDIGFFSLLFRFRVYHKFWLYAIWGGLSAEINQEQLTCDKLPFDFPFLSPPPIALWGFSTFFFNLMKIKLNFLSLIIYFIHLFVVHCSLANTFLLPVIKGNCMACRSLSAAVLFSFANACQFDECVHVENCLPFCCLFTFAHNLFSPLLLDDLVRLSW